MSTYSIMMRLIASGLVDRTNKVTPEDLQQLFIDELHQARREYNESIQDFTSAIEIERHRLLGELSNLQSEVTFSVATRSLSIKLLAQLFEQTIAIYSAHSELDLKLISLGIEQIQTILKRYRRVLRRHAVAHVIARVISILAIVALVYLIYLGMQADGPTTRSMLPIIQIPITVVVWSLIGSFIAILVQFNNFDDSGLRNPFNWLFLRPLIGLLMGSLSYLLLRILFLSVIPNQDLFFGSFEIVWLIAFVCGFSDRLAQWIIRVFIGGSDDNGNSAIALNDLATPKSINSTGTLINDLLGLIKWSKDAEQEPSIVQLLDENNILHKGRETAKNMAKRESIQNTTLNEDPERLSKKRT